MAANNKFVELSPEEIENNIIEATPKNTRRATSWGVNIFRDWLAKRYPEESIENLSHPNLADCLKKFYQELRKSPIEHYSSSAHLGIRAALERHFCELPEFENISIIRDPLFRTANRSLNAKLKLIKSQGYDKVQHHPSITFEDLRKCYSTKVFGDENPWSLLRVNWFNICFYFGRRGRSDQRALKKECFVIKVNPQGVEYVTKTKIEMKPLQKKCKTSDDSDTRMVATNALHCPVMYFKKLLNVLNPIQDALFQNPKKVYTPGQKIWFENSPIGVNRLAMMMKNISHDACLSTIYTNHCVRSTTASLLEAVIMPCHPMIGPFSQKSKSATTGGVNFYCERLMSEKEKHYTTTSNTPSSGFVGSNDCRDDLKDKHVVDENEEGMSQININIVANVKNSSALNLLQGIDFKDCKITFNIAKK